MNYHIDILPFSMSKNHPYKFDKNNVILSKIPYTEEYHHHTTAIASYAIDNIEDSKIFDSQIEWLENNINDDGTYKHNFTFPYYNNFSKPWIGGLCQGLAISALIRAYQKKDKRKYLETAKKAYSCLIRNIDDDGCIFTDNEGNKWIEEYPFKPHILNGFIYALFGIYDLYKVTKTKKIKIFFDNCLNTIKINLKNYDLGFWSLYDLNYRLPSTLFYHSIHIKQLYALHQITEEKILENYSIKWKNNFDNSYNRAKAKIKRNMVIIKKHGIIGSFKRHNQRRRWLSG